MPTLSELAARIGAEVAGSGERRVAGLKSLEDAGPDDLSFVAGRRQIEAAARSAAGALVVESETARALPGRDLLVVDDPRRAVAGLLEILYPPRAPAAGVHPTAIVGDGCSVDPSAHVGPYAVIGEGCEIGAGVIVGAHAVVGHGCRLGAGSRLHPHAVLYDATELGERCEIQAGAVVGADGFGFVPGGAETDGMPRKVPQVGRTVLEADVEVGANTTIDRGALGETRVGRGSKLDNLVHLAHNVRLGTACLLAAQTGIAGSTRLGDGVMAGGQSGVSDHLEIGDGVQIAGKSAVFGSVAAGQRVGGIPAEPILRWQRRTLLLDRVPEMRRRIAALERALGEEETVEEEEES